MAQDVFLSMLYLGNYADIDTNESNRATENEASLLGTYGSPGNPLSNQIVDVESDSPTAFIDTDHDTGNGTLTYDAGAGSVIVGLDSFVTFNGTVIYGDGTNENIVIDIFQMTNGDLFMPAWDGYSQFADKPIESITLSSVDFDRWAGVEQSSYDSVQFVCYGPGTMIETPDGPRAIETLQVGDLVTTLDHGPQPIRWTHSDVQPLEVVDEGDHYPVLISAGALGPERPSQDLIVSPQHRILIGGHGQFKGPFNAEAFAPAKSITSMTGIRHMRGKNQITWFHFACDRHEIIFANGCLSESLLLGPMVMNGLADKERQALNDIFGTAPGPEGALNGPPARQCLKVAKVRRLLGEYSQTKRKCTASEIREWDRDLAMEKYETEQMLEARSTNQSQCAPIAVARLWSVSASD